MDAFRIMEAPSRSNGSAFWTVKSMPFTLVLNIVSKNSSVDRAERRIFRNPGVCEYDIQPALLIFDLRDQAIEIRQVRHIALNGGHVFPDLPDRCIQLRLTAASDKDIRAFLYELFHRGKADAAIASGYKCDFSFKFVRMAHCQSLFALPGKSQNKLKVNRQRRIECACSIKLTSKLLIVII